MFKCSLNREGLSLLTRNSYIDPHMIRRCKELWRIIINLLAVYWIKRFVLGTTKSCNFRHTMIFYCIGKWQTEQFHDSKYTEKKQMSKKPRLESKCLDTLWYTYLATRAALVVKIANDDNANDQRGGYQQYACVVKALSKGGITEATDYTSGSFGDWK